MKFQRQGKLLEIIANEDIETQEELSDRLRNAGFTATQATISRDIKELRLIKKMTNHGTYRYTVSAEEGETRFSPRLKTIFRESVISFDSAQNIVVIKTLPGLAPAACSAIDSLNTRLIVGTLAGDDTGFLVMRDSESAVTFVEEIKRMLE